MRIRIFGVACLTLALSGCWVLDELDAGNKKMDLYMKKKPAEEEPATGPSRRSRQPAGDYFASQKNPKTFTPGTVSSDIVSCKLKSGTQFMKVADCESRGGVPGR